MADNQPMQQPAQPAPQEPGKSKAGMWLLVVVVVVVIAVVVWFLVK